MKIRNSEGKVVKVPKEHEQSVRDLIAKGDHDTLTSMANGGWIKHAVNPAHKGFCTPMSKKTCTPRRKALARTFKKHHGFHDNGGQVSKQKPEDDQLQDIMKPGLQNDPRIQEALTFISASLQQGLQPREIVAKLTQQGIPQNIARRLINQVLTSDFQQGDNDQTSKPPVAALGDEVGNQQEQDQLMRGKQSMLTPQNSFDPLPMTGMDYLNNLKNRPNNDTNDPLITEAQNPQVSTTSGGLMDGPVVNQPPADPALTRSILGRNQKQRNPLDYLYAPYYTRQAMLGSDARQQNVLDKQVLQATGGSRQDIHGANVRIAGNDMQIAGGAIGQIFQGATDVLSPISSLIANQRTNMWERGVKNAMNRERADIKPYYGDSSELGGGTRAAYSKYGGKLTYGGKLGYLDNGGVNNGNGQANVITERNEITNNGDRVFQEGGDLHSDPSGGNVRSYKPGTVVLSNSIGMKVGEMMSMLPALPGGEAVAAKLSEKYKDPNKPITYADAGKLFTTDDLDKQILNTNKKMNKEELYATSNNETKVSQTTSKLNLQSLAKKAQALKAERDANIAITGPDGPLHLLSEHMKKTGAYGADIKEEAKAKYGKMIKLPKADNGWTEPTAAQYRKLAAMEWLGTDEPSADQKAAGLKKGFNKGIDPKLLVSYLKTSGYTPPGGSWDNITQEDLQNHVYDWDSKNNGNKIKEYLYNRYLPTIQGQEWFKQKGYTADTPFYQLDPEDIDKVFKDQKLGVRFGEAAGLMHLNTLPPADNTAPAAKANYQLPTFTATGVGANKKRPYYQEGLNPAQIAAPFMDLLASKQPVPYIEDQGAKQALAASTRQRFTDIQPQLNRITRGVRSATQHNPTDAAANAQLYSNAYEAANQVYGQKYNMDNQIEQRYNDTQNELMMKAGTNKAQALDTLAQRTATRDWKDYALRRNAVGEMSNKYLQQQAENRASVLYQDMFPNFNYNPGTGTTYQGNWSPQAGALLPYLPTGAKDKGYDEEKWTDEYGHEHVQRTPKVKYGGKVKLPKKSPKRK